MVQILSFQKTVWRLGEKPSSSIDKALAMYPKPIRSVLFHRGVVDYKSSINFFNPTIDGIHHPLLLHSMDKAVNTIIKALKNRSKICIHGDFDVDGVCGTAIILDYIKKIGGNVFYHIPHRVEEGYGISKNSLEKVIRNKAQLLITVDCGIRDIDLIDYAQKKGLTVIVTDHHLVKKDKDGKYILPNVEAIIHPQNPNGSYPYPYLSGAGTIWKLVCALELFFQGKPFTEVAVSYLDLVALATVCDIMPLTEENRVLVKLGLERVSAKERIGIKALIEQAGLASKSLNSYHLGYILGPRLNAAGRLSSADEALELLIAGEEAMAHAIASSLNSLNKHRQKLTEIALEEAEKQLTEKYPLIFVSGRNWNEGIIGLVAGKLMEKYHKPAIVVKEGEKIAKGSARSIKHFNIVDALHTFSGYILQFGGHEMAAGFTTTTDRLKPLKQSLLQFSAKTISEEHLIRELFIDDEISANEIDFNLTTLLNRVEPTGYMNPTPLFKIGPLRVIKVYAIGQESRHIKIFLLDPSTNKTLEGVWFDPPADAFAIREGDKIIIAGSIGEEEWNNHRKIQIKIKDIKIES